MTEDTDGLMRLLHGTEEPSFANQDSPSVACDQLHMDCETVEEGDEGIPASLETALILNKAYQEIISEALSYIDVAIAHTRDQRDELLQTVDTLVKEKAASGSRRKKSLFQLVYPYFRDVNGMPAPRNEDCALRELQQFFPMEPPKNWKEAELSGLAKAVHGEALRSSMMQTMSRREVECEKLAGVKVKISAINNVKSAEYRNLKEQQAALEECISKTDAELESIRKNFAVESVIDDRQADWLRISMIEFEGKHTSESCAAVWRNVIHPSINRGEWTADEDKRLADLVARHKEHNWAVIAAELGTGRSPFLCLQRYQQTLNESIKKSWDPEDDEMLRDAVLSEQSDRGVIPWQQIGAKIQRSAVRCQLRWSLIRPMFKKGPWTADEDSLLVEAAAMFGIAGRPWSWSAPPGGSSSANFALWVRVEGHVKTRSAMQCKSRWANSLDPNLKFGKWTLQEDATITRWIEKNGKGKWIELADRLSGRTPNMLLQRAKRLLGNISMLRKGTNVVDGDDRDEQASRDDGVAESPAEQCSTEDVFSRRTKVARSAEYERRQEVLSGLLMARIASNIAREVPQMDADRLKAMLLSRIQSCMTGLSAPLPANTRERILASIAESVPGSSNLKAAAASYVENIVGSPKKSPRKRSLRVAAPKLVSKRRRRRRRQDSSSSSAEDTSDNDEDSASVSGRRSTRGVGESANVDSGHVTGDGQPGQSALSANKRQRLSAAAAQPVEASEQQPTSKRKCEVKCDSQQTQKQKKELWDEEQRVEASIMEQLIAIEKASRVTALADSGSDSAAATGLFMQALGLQYPAVLPKLTDALTRAAADKKPSHMQQAQLGNTVPALLDSAAAKDLLDILASGANEMLPRGSVGGTPAFNVGVVGGVLPFGGQTMTSVLNSITGVPILSPCGQVGLQRMATVPAGSVLNFATSLSIGGIVNLACLPVRAAGTANLKVPIPRNTNNGRAALASTFPVMGASSAAPMIHQGIRVTQAFMPSATSTSPAAPMIYTGIRVTQASTPSATTASSAAPVIHTGIRVTQPSTSSATTASSAASMIHSGIRVTQASTSCATTASSAAPMIHSGIRVDAGKKNGSTTAVAAAGKVSSLGAPAAGAANSGPVAAAAKPVLSSGARKLAPAPGPSLHAQLPTMPLPPQKVTVAGYRQLLNNRSLLESIVGVLTKKKLEQVQQSANQASLTPAYRTLRSRFLTLFTWPAILATVPPSGNQSDTASSANGRSTVTLDTASAQMSESLPS